MSGKKNQLAVMKAPAMPAQRQAKGKHSDRFEWSPATPPGDLI